MVTANTISGNMFDGVDIFGGAVGNTIGGLQPADANTIASNTWGGVDVSGTGTSDNVVGGNFIGTNSSDALCPASNGLVGVTIFGGATDNTIGGEPVVIDGIHSDIISISFANTIVSNGALGGVDIENSGHDEQRGRRELYRHRRRRDHQPGQHRRRGPDLGRARRATRSAGPAFLAGNLIAANTGAGVDITGTGTSRTARWRGTLSAPTPPVPPTWATGPRGSSSRMTRAANNTIGGAANVIAGNMNDGIDLVGPGTSGVTIENNFIGTDSAGDSGLGNAFWGVYADDVPNVVVGASGAGNVVSGNDQGGVTFRGISSVNESIQANLIGVAPDGTSPLGNAFSGVLIGDWGVSGDFPSGRDDRRHDQRHRQHHLGQRQMGRLDLRHAPVSPALLSRKPRSAPTPTATPGWATPLAGCRSIPPPRTTRSAAPRPAPAMSSRITATTES